MTLRQQFSLLTSALVLILLAGNLLVTLMHAHDQFQRQLNARAYDAATALALSMSQIEGDDTVERSRLIDVLFDRGFFSEIRFVSTEGQEIHRRELQAYESPAAPAWFMGMTSFDQQPAETDVTNGWQRLGTVTVLSHPDFAYRNLWNMAKAELFWFVAVLIVTLILLEMLLRWLFAPLQKVEEQALAICDREWKIQQDIPKARELKRMVLAMNRMVSKLHALFMEQATTTEQLRQESFHDNVSGLLNRRGFDQRFSHLLNDDDEHSGLLMLLQIEGFAAFNQRDGRQAGDAVIRQVGDALHHWHHDHNHSLCGRHAGADFALYVSCADRQHARELLMQTSSQLAATTLTQRNELQFHIGGVFLQGHHNNPGEAFSKADAALAKARSSGRGHSWLYDEENDPERREWSASTWQQILREALQDNLLQLRFMPVVGHQQGSSKRPLLQVEVFSRIQWQGESLSAARFWPMVEQHGMAGEFDLAVVRQVFTDLANTRLPEAIKVCINLSPASLLDAEFPQHLIDLLEQHSALAHHLLLEVPEFCILDIENQLLPLGQRLKPLGVKLGVDQVGTGTAAFAYMKRLPLTQLRLDGSLNRGVHLAQDQRFFVQSMIQIGHKLDLTVLADGLEQSEDVITLSQCGVDGISGFYFSRPLSHLQDVIDWAS
ncbi:EAL domain-containing protein [Parathalassolituus penaei]|uniref:EAL domain-containing protein n=1 Tax=Parathalassolituus penaei TaxID=2997323 RepID=A0A9X3EQB2_9GAMM|nr:EAL domain-containing protein [Parathalassolituus penaei]MCY0966913.1 EAL domain-containing protein [Parathalassolituus penaei]